MTPSNTPLLKLNLGCGFKRIPGYLNVDSVPDCNPDQVVDLEKFPWPWADNSVDDVQLIHVLERLGRDHYFQPPNVQPLVLAAWRLACV